VSRFLLQRGLLIWALLSAGTLVTAQVAQPPAVPAQDAGQGETVQPNITSSTPQETTALPPSSEAHVPTPLPLSIDASMLEFSPELAHTNYVQAGVSAGASYDTNLLAQSSNEVGGAIYTVTPNIGLNMSRPRLLWSLNYSGGYLVNQRYSNFNQASHNASVDIRYRLTPHVNFRVNDHFLFTGTFLDQLTANTTGLGAGIIQQPNQAILTPIAQRTDDMGTAEITYQYSAGDMIGATGSVYTSHFGNVPTGAPQLLGTTSETGSGFYTHRITTRNWSGVAYTYQRLRFSPDTQQVDTHSFFLFHTIYLRTRMQLALFAGPEYTDFRGQVVDNTVSPPQISTAAHQRWSTAGGASFSWQGQRTGIRASGIRKVSDGGGLLEAVTVTTGEGAVRRQLTRTSNLEFSAIYANSRALQQGASSFLTLKSTSVSVAWEQQIGRNFTANFGYGRDYQQESATSIPGLDINHNRGWVTLAYGFTHPIGR